MKTNEIILEGPWDVIKGAAKGAWAGAKSQVGQQGQINRQRSDHEKEINSNNSIIYKDWMGKVEPQLQNKDPKYYYTQLKNYVEKQYGNGVGGVDSTGISKSVQIPTTVDDVNIKNVINQITRNYFAKKAGITPAAPTKQRSANGRFAPKAGSPTSPGTPPTAAPGTPPTAAPSTPPTAAPSTPPAPKPAAFDSVKQSLNGLSKKEKQKLLTQLLSDLGSPVR